MTPRIGRVAAPVLFGLALITVAAAESSASGGGASPESWAAQRSRYLMGTLCTAVAHAADTVTAAGAANAGLDEIARLEGILSSWREDTDLARLNAVGGLRPTPCADELYEVLAVARTMAELTDGAYDPTIEPLVEAWDLRGEGRVPSDAQRERALRRVGWQKLTLDPDARTVVFEKSGMAVELGGIGKGFALDHAAVVMQIAGATRGLINFGGEICAFSDDAEWTIAIADPSERMRPVLSFAARDVAVSTSAQSERGFDKDGVRYGHVLDPRTGRPVASRAAVTVIAGSATQADALSTALFVMGRSQAAAFAREHPEIAVVWLEQSGGEVLAWRWNGPPFFVEEGASVRWMDDADNDEGTPSERDSEHGDAR